MPLNSDGLIQIKERVCSYGRNYSDKGSGDAHTTFAKMAHAMGYTYGLHRELAPVYDTELPKAREEFKLHKAALAKKRQRAANKNGKAK
jgi:hypothetical protein